MSRVSRQTTSFDVEQCQPDDTDNRAVQLRQAYPYLKTKISFNTKGRVDYASGEKKVARVSSKEYLRVSNTKQKPN